METSDPTEAGGPTSFNHRGQCVSAGSENGTPARTSAASAPIGIFRSKLCQQEGGEIKKIDWFDPEFCVLMDIEEEKRSPDCIRCLHAFRFVFFFLFFSETKKW